MHSVTFFQKVRNEHFENRFFPFASWHQGEEYATILTASTVESYIGTMQKHQELTLSGFAHTSMTPTFLFFGVLRHLFKYLMTSSVGTEGNDPKTTRTGNLHHFVTFGENLRSIGRQIRHQDPLILICEGSKNPLLETGSRL